jgi:hypothetical protein
VGLKAQSITFSELNYNSDSTTNSGNWVELYNYGSTSIDLSSWYIKDDNSTNIFIFPSGTILQAGARLVVGSDDASFLAEYPSVANYIGEISFNFANDSDEVRLFDNGNNLKVFMHYSDSLPWPEAADGTGRTLELIDPAVSTDDPSNWFVGCMFGSPGEAFTPCDDLLVFDEINYNSDTLLDAGDWVELHNRSLNGINLTGWSFKDSKDDNAFYFPTNTQIPPSGRLVLVHDTAKFKTRHPALTGYLGPFIFNLSNDGELIRLFNSQGRISFSIVYDDDGAWPAPPDGDGYTLELLNAAADMNSYTDWFSGCLEGSPGHAYDPDCNIGIDEATTQLQSLVATVENSWLILHLDGGPGLLNDAFIASIYNDTGSRILDKEFSFPGTRINTMQFLPGIYIISVTNGKAHWSQKIIIH